MFASATGMLLWCLSSGNAEPIQIAAFDGVDEKYGFPRNKMKPAERWTVVVDGHAEP